MKNSKQKYDFGHLMNERLSDDKFKSIFKPERIKVASLDSPPNSIMEILALSEEFEKLQLSKYASVMLKVAEGMDDPNFQEPEVGEIVEDNAIPQEPEQPPAGQKPRDWMACNVCKHSHKYDLFNDETLMKCVDTHMKEEKSVPDDLLARLRKEGK